MRRLTAHLHRSVRWALGSFVVAGLLGALSASADVENIWTPSSSNPWADILTPTQGTQGPIGFYSSGCLDGALSLPMDGPGYQTMQLSRRRFFGHSSLLHYIRAFTDETLRKKVGVLLIGDLGQARGGPMPEAHLSHQTGLDVDIWYWINPDAQMRPLTLEERETLTRVHLVDLETGKIIWANWKLEHAKMLEIAARFNEVERIFVNPAIKRELCNMAGTNRLWLQKLRPWAGHHDHFHVRLQCPGMARSCVSQEPVPPGDGCGSELDWWLSADGVRFAREVMSRDGVLPEDALQLPPACDIVLKASRRR